MECFLHDKVHKKYINFSPNRKKIYITSIAFNTLYYKMERIVHKLARAIKHSVKRR